MIRARHFLRRLRQNRSGIAMTEFALSMPFLLTTGLWGIETANFAVINMKVTELAGHIADNASRIGDTSVLEKRPIYESDINDLLAGANRQGGVRLDFFRFGRAIISSLELYREADHCDADGNCPATSANEGEQFIHWLPGRRWMPLRRRGWGCRCGCSRNRGGNGRRLRVQMWLRGEWAG